MNEEETKSSIEELKKAVLFSDTTCGINFNYTLSIKDVKLTLKYVEQLQQDLEKANETIEQLQKELKCLRMSEEDWLDESLGEIK